MVRDICHFLWMMRCIIIPDIVATVKNNDSFDHKRFKFKTLNKMSNKQNE